MEAKNGLEVVSDGTKWVVRNVLNTTIIVFTAPLWVPVALVILAGLPFIKAMDWAHGHSHW